MAGQLGVHLYLPQVRLSLDDLVARAHAAEAAGFEGIALMDHLAPPLAEDQPMYEALTTATWLAARTTRLRLGVLVLCDALRHPAVLARQAVTLDHASGGRLDLGLGWGSVADELVRFGVTAEGPGARARRLRETIEVLRALWTGAPVTYAGAVHRIDGGLQLPAPLDRIPLVVGGVGPAALALAAEHADWWNVPSHRLDGFAAGRDQVRPARSSVLQVIGFVAPGADRTDVAAATRRRYGAMGDLLVGGPEEVVDHLGRWHERGAERVYLWFGDRARPETLAAFGETVLAPLGARVGIGAVSR